ncbi:hypothetical protein SAMN04488109_6133 [Chryseolinea serpens]|uniref:Holin-X, holin superfamily III n=1 Tax=Chryseolinea serpens TaxID=947013 RepID=A0A1M5WYS8_9BACT|nr:hypothetical protein [Chryseolinea serpens]SHH92458.1 hypothetical protein SAMN04488109_6133 [Chryseolinea serpens]
METYRNLVTVRVVEQTTLGASMSIVGILFLLVVVFILLFIGVGLAWWAGETLDNMKAGFFIVGGFYVLVLLILLLTARKVLLPNIRNLLIKKIYDQD